MPFEWSFSRWAVYDQCPYRAMLQYIMGLDQGPETEALRRGNAIHKLAEDYVNAPRMPPSIPEVLRVFAEELKWMRGVNAKAEHECAVNDEWSPTKRYGSWNAWLRVRLDIVAMPDPKTLYIADWKTGKIYADKHSTQMELYATALFSHYPEVERIDTELFYIDQRKKAPNSYLRRQHENMIAMWNRRVTPMFNDRDFVPCPNNLCGWCPYTAEKGGPCHF